MSVAADSAQVERTDSLEVRRVTPADCEALEAMYRSFEPKAAILARPPRELPQRWLERLTAFSNFVVVTEGRAVGHAVLLAARDTGEVAVFIHQDFRGHGLGKRLLREAISEARRMGLRRVWGMTEVDNMPMVRLAFSEGFTPGKEPGEYYVDLSAKGQGTN